MTLQLVVVQYDPVMKGGTGRRVECGSGGRKKYRG